MIDNCRNRGLTMSESRKDVLLKALEAEVGGESVDLEHPVHRRRRRLVAVRDRVRAERRSLTSPPSARWRSPTS